MEAQIREAEPREIQRRLNDGEPLILIDVREPFELSIAAIAGAQLCPMSRAHEWIDRLPRDGELVIFCHHGMRSMQVAYALAQRGYLTLTNMTGGIDLWAEQVDTKLPRY